MSAMKANKNKFAKFLSYLALLLIVVALVGFFAFFTNDFTDEFKTFYVENNGQILSDNNEIAIPCGEDIRFDCKYTFGFLSKKETKGFNVKVIPNITDETDFDFTVDGQPYSYSGEKDLSGLFNITKNDNAFSINIPKGTTMQSLLSSIYSDKVVIVPDTVIMNKPYFSIVISSYNDKVSYNIKLNLNTTVTKVILDNEVIEI